MHLDELTERSDARMVLWYCEERIGQATWCKLGGSKLPLSFQACSQQSLDRRSCTTSGCKCNAAEGPWWTVFRCSYKRLSSETESIALVRNRMSDARLSKFFSKLQRAKVALRGRRPERMALAVTSANVVHRRSWTASGGRNKMRQGAAT